MVPRSIRCKREAATVQLHGFRMLLKEGLAVVYMSESFIKILKLGASISARCLARSRLRGLYQGIYGSWAHDTRR